MANERCGNCGGNVERGPGRPVKCANENPCPKRVCGPCATEEGPYCKEHKTEALKNGE